MTGLLLPLMNMSLMIIMIYLLYSEENDDIGSGAAALAWLLREQFYGYTQSKKRGGLVIDVHKFGFEIETIASIED